MEQSWKDSTKLHEEEAKRKAWREVMETGKTLIIRVTTFFATVAFFVLVYYGEQYSEPLMHVPMSEIPLPLYIAGVYLLGYLAVILLVTCVFIVGCIALGLWLIGDIFVDNVREFRQAIYKLRTPRA